MDQNPNRDERGRPVPRGRDGFNAAYGLAKCMGMVTAPFTQTDFGAEYFRHGWVTLLGMIAWAGQARSEAVLLYVCAWVVALLFQRTRTAALERGGAAVHSRRPGRSWLARLAVPWVERERTAKVVEAMGCFIVGSLLTAASVPLGTMIVGVSVANFFGLAVDAELGRRERRDAKDRRIEAAHRAALWRGEEDY